MWGESLKKLNINNIEYEIIENYKDALDFENLSEMITDFYDVYDYLVGDWAYGKLRIKGFCVETNKNFNDINNYHNIKEYIDNYCAYGCKYFILKKLIIENK